MKVEVEIDEERLAKEVAVRLGREHWISSTLESKVRAEAHAVIDKLPVAEMVNSYISGKLNEILEDVVNRQLRHIVKLAVDRELAAARVVAQEGSPEAGE